MTKEEHIQKRIDLEARNMAFGMLFDALGEITPPEKIGVVNFVREHRNVSNRLTKVLDLFMGPEADTREEAFKSAAAFLSNISVMFDQYLEQFEK